MQSRQLAGLGLGFLAAATFAVAGCTGGNKAPEGAKAPASTAPSSVSPAATAPSSSFGPADPVAAATLATAAASLANTSFKIEMTSGTALSLTGLMDAPNHKGTATLKVNSGRGGLTVESMLIGPDMYIRAPGFTSDDTWKHIDVSRLPKGASLGLRPGQIDPANTVRLLTSATDVHPVDPRSYQGTLDLTKAAGITGVNQATIDRLGPGARQVPFTAELDGQGRLSMLTIELPAVGGRPAQPLEVLYSDYGTPVNVQKPPANKVTEAPEGLYRLLGR